MVPITEVTTGLDLVKMQLAIAGGGTLIGDPPPTSGHAIEVRLNAEDPDNFLPSPGTITQYHAPGGPGIRVDTHIYNGYVVPPYYDSMIAKLVAHGDDRAAALARMRGALSEIVIDGIKTNIALHQDICSDCVFIEGGSDIHYLEKKLG